MSLKSQKGFTIVELSIATAVFSMILVVIVTGILTFSTNYIRGTNRLKTQEAARSIDDDLTQSLQYASTYTTTTSGGWTVYCVDNVKYSVRLNMRFTSANPTTSHALVRSPMTGACTPDDGTVAGDTELLGDNMRLASFSITQSDRSFGIALRVVYGEDDLLTGSGDAMNCKVQSGSQYCAVSSFTSMVQQRL